MIREKENVYAAARAAKSIKRRSRRGEEIRDSIITIKRFSEGVWEGGCSAVDTKSGIRSMSFYVYKGGTG